MVEVQTLWNRSYEVFIGVPMRCGQPTVIALGLPIAVVAKPSPLPALPEIRAMCPDRPISVDLLHEAVELRLQRECSVAAQPFRVLVAEAVSARLVRAVFMAAL